MLFVIYPKSFRQNQGGYIALIALLIVAAVGLSIGLSVSLAGIEDLQMSFTSIQVNRAYNLANACLEEGLNKLRNNWLNYSGTLLLDGHSCIINVAVLGSRADLEAAGNVSDFHQKIRTQVDPGLNILEWQEN